MGHSGGEYFLLPAESDGVDPPAETMLDTPWSVAGRAVSLSLSLAMLVGVPGSVTDHRQPDACLAPPQKAARALGEASWILGQAGMPRREIRRGAEAGMTGWAGPGTKPW
ncbi:hypothetical protein [Streptomyces sp. NBC_01314]|uniref:hypothetical protein n=1 Tax=Streptomyces sp. NBC_01314 TaxID=2903821 RepID=UPI0030925EE6|nr:hypothetical protein OG622_41015 [Streptomyces sp. NBC_01314]